MKKVSILISIVTIAVLSLCIAGCSNAPEGNDLWKNATYTEDTQLGEGAKTLFVEVKAEDKSVTFTIRTDKETVGEALSEHKLIEGEEGAYGIFVHKVNGIEAVYNKNKSYWSFNKNGEYMPTGVDSTKFSDGEHYELVYTK